MSTKEKAAGLAPKAAKRKTRCQKYTTSSADMQEGNIPSLGTFLESLLLRYRNSLIALPFSIDRSRAIEHIDRLLEMARPREEGQSW